MNPDNNTDGLDNLNKPVTFLFATHNERLSWVNILPKERDYRVVVSCSSDTRTEKEFPSVDDFYLRENWGREAGHYLEYIIRCYESLSQTTVFLQAGCWDHLKTDALVSDLLKLFFANELCDFPAPMAYVGRPYACRKFPVKETSAIYPILKAAWGKDYGGGPKQIPPSIPFKVGAQIYVQKEVIHAMPKEFYETLYEEGKKCPRSFAHAVEPIWGCLFNHTFQ